MSNDRFRDTLYKMTGNARIAETATMDNVLSAMGIRQMTAAQGRDDLVERAHAAGRGGLLDRCAENILDWATDRQLEGEVRDRLKFVKSAHMWAQSEFLAEALRTGKMMSFGASTSFPLMPDIGLISSWFRQYAAQIVGQIELVGWDFFHVRDTSAVGETSIFFWGETSGNATYLRQGTNLGTANEMLGKEAFMVFSHAFTTLSATADTQSATSSAVVQASELHRRLFTPAGLEFKLGGKTYLLTHASQVPWGHGVKTAWAQGTVWTQAIAYNEGDRRTEPIPYVIPPDTQFIGEAFWNVVRAITTAAFIGWVMRGIYARPAR